MTAPSDSAGDMKKTSEKGLVYSTIIGLLIVFLTFFTLYRSERINNRAWQTKRADTINPAQPDAAEGFVKFSGIPSGGLVDDELSGEKFVYLRKSFYEYKKVRKIKNELVTKDGKSEYQSRAYYENDWSLVNNDTAKAEDLMVGKCNIRLSEAELMGTSVWEKTIYKPDVNERRKTPIVGDKKYELTGINARYPIFVVGHLQSGYIGSGALFIVSGYSEVKTIDRLHEKETGFFSGTWIRNFICFIFLFIGFVILSHPVMFLLNKYQEYPVLKFLSKLGWGVFIILSLIFSYLIIKFSFYTAELIWFVVAVIVLVPAFSLYKKIRSSSA